MKFLIPIVALVAATSGGVVWQQKTQPPVKQTQEQKLKRKAMGEQDRALYEQKLARKKAQSADAAALKDKLREIEQRIQDAKKAQTSQMDIDRLLEQRKQLIAEFQKHQAVKKGLGRALSKKKRADVALKTKKELDPNVVAKRKLGEPGLSQKQKVVQLLTTEDVSNAFTNAPVLAEMTISYHPIAGLEGQSQWHIGDTHWWVRLHGAVPEAIVLDKTKTYRVTGIVLEQNYGVIEVWVQELGPVN